MTSILESIDLRYPEDPSHAPVGGGAEVYYELWGETSSPALVTVNNFTLIAPIWRAFSQVLAQTHRVVNWDLRHQGASKRGDQPLRWEDNVEDLARLLDHLEIDKTYLLGSSISCLIVRDFAIKYPDRVTGIIFQAPAFSPYGGRQREFITRAWLQTLAAYGPEGLWTHLYGQAYCGQTQEAMGAAGYGALAQMFCASHSAESLREFMQVTLLADDGPTKLQQLDCPALLQIGDGDFMWSQSQAEDTLALLKQGKLDIIPRAGHVALMENPEAFLVSCATFLAAVEAGI